MTLGSSQNKFNFIYCGNFNISNNPLSTGRDSLSKSNGVAMANSVASDFIRVIDISPFQGVL